MYITILVISYGILACNNRGENTGNLQTLQHATTPLGLLTLLSGYAEKWASRNSMQARGANVWRKSVEADECNPGGYLYGDNDSFTMKGAEPPTPLGFDDGAFGYMGAPKGSTEQHATQVAGAIEFSTALSTTLYTHDIAFVQGIKAAPNNKGLSERVPFIVERHFTRYQYTITINIPDAKEKGFSFPLFLESLKYLAVGGNHASNATEISPEVIAYRFHKAPGRGGLYLGAGLDIPPNAPVDLAPLKAHCDNLGIDYNVAGTGTGKTVAQALQDILDEITRLTG